MSKQRCLWCQGSDLYEKYHDLEWGVPEYNDQKLFEILSLEIFQAGLSWITVLKKRDHFRKAFDDFNPAMVAQYDSKQVLALLNDSGIIRHRAKIEATIHNAHVFLQLQQESGSFSKYIWSFVNHIPKNNRPKKANEIPSSTKLSADICKNLKAKGFKFLGATTVYSFMQAAGLVNDHLASCFKQQPSNQANL